LITSKLDNQENFYVANATKIVDFAFSMIEKSSSFKIGAHTVQFRIGVHIGDVINGVIGKSKPVFDLWSDDVNIASRLEDTGMPQKVHCSQEFFHVVGKLFAHEARGRIRLRDKGEMETYFLNHPLPRNESVFGHLAKVDSQDQGVTQATMAQLTKYEK